MLITMTFTETEEEFTCCGAKRPRKEVSTKYKGKKFYFCDTQCLKVFKKNPERFVSSTHLLLDFEQLEDV